MEFCSKDSSIFFDITFINRIHSQTIIYYLLTLIQCFGAFKHQYMEIQKHLFRVTERTLKYQNCRTYCYLFFLGSLLISLVQLLAFVNASWLTNHTILEQCFINAGNKLQPKIANFSQIPSDYIVSFYSEEEFGKLKSEAQLIENDHCSIRMNASKSKEQDVARPYMQYAEQSNTLSLTLDQRNKLNIHNYSVFLKYSVLQTTFNLVDKTQLNINQILDALSDRTIKSMQLRIGDYSLQDYISQSEPLWYEKLYKLAKHFLLFCAISLGTSFYIYATIVAAPAVIILCIQCTRFGRGEAMNEVYRIFSWIGLHVMIRKTAASEKVRSSAVVDICFSFLLYFLILYMIYYVIMFAFSQEIFDNLCPPGLQEIISSYIAVIEFASIIYMRTRPFLNYFPKLNSLLMLIFFLYTANVQLGYKKNLLYFIIFDGIAIFCYMVLTLQIPAVNEWNPEEKYTPTLDRPRIGFIPFFNMNWMNNLPDEWTRLIPLFGGQNFSQRQMSLMNRDFQQFQTYLRENNNDE